MPVKADLVIAHANELLTMAGFSHRPKVAGEMSDLGIVRDGAVAIRGDRIAMVGTSSEVINKVDKGFDVIDASGKVVSPGFVDPHTHLIFSGTREDELEMMIKGMGYLEIKRAGGGMIRSVLRTREASFGELVSSAKKILDRMLVHGTTTAEAKSGYDMRPEGEIRLLEVIGFLNKTHPIDLVPTFCCQAVPPEWEGRLNGLAKEVAERWLPMIAKRGLAEYADVFCEAGYYNVEQSRIMLEAARRLGLRLRIHADWLSHSGGAALGAELGVVSADHLIYTPKEEIERLAKAGAIGVLLPTTPFCYLGKYADAKGIMASGLPVALGTDLSAIDMSESMQMMMAIAAFQMKMTPAEVFSAATINAAHALNRGQEVGSIEEGKKADIIILDMPNHKFIPFHYGVNLVETTIKAGRVVAERGRLREDWA